MKFHLADLNSGIFDTVDTYEDALFLLDCLIEEGIELEKEIQYASKLTDEEIEAKVRAFYCIIEE